jgi:hypothetical protein
MGIQKNGAKVLRSPQGRHLQVMGSNDQQTALLVVDSQTDVCGVTMPTEINRKRY